MTQQSVEQLVKMVEAIGNLARSTPRLSAEVHPEAYGIGVNLNQIAEMCAYAVNEFKQNEKVSK